MEELNLDYFRTLFKKTINELEEEAFGFQHQEDRIGDYVDEVINERDRQLLLKLKGRKRFLYRKVKSALGRIEEGRFGICVTCEGPIQLNRLKARPIANQCISCREEQERNEEHILYHKKTHTQGKTFVSDNILSFLPFDEDDSSQDNVTQFKKRTRFKTIV